MLSRWNSSCNNFYKHIQFPTKIGVRKTFVNLYSTLKVHKTCLYPGAHVAGFAVKKVILRINDSPVDTNKYRVRDNYTYMRL